MQRVTKRWFRTTQAKGFGGAKVATKEATTKAGLPGWEDAASKEE